MCRMWSARRATTSSSRLSKQAMIARVCARKGALEPNHSGFLLDSVYTPEYNKKVRLSRRFLGR